MGTKNELKTKKELDADNLKHAATIRTAVNIKTTFELYAYRVMHKEAFEEEVQMLCEEYLTTIKKLK